MAAKGNKKNKKATVAAAPVAVADDTASDTSSVDATPEPHAEAPVDEAAPIEEGAAPVEEEAAPAEVQETAPVVEETVAEVGDENVVQEKAEPEVATPLTHEVLVMSDNTPRSPRHDVLAVPTTESGMWFLHPSYYYQKTKEVYVYTTSFRGVSSVAQVGESSVNYLLKQLNLKQVATLQDVDTSLAPALATIDEQLEERVAGVLKTLVDGQEYLLATKEAVVGRAKEVQSATLEKVTAATTTATDKVHCTVTKTVDTVAIFKTSTIDLVEKTRESVTQATSSALDTVSKAKQATVETLTTTAHTFLSYVPILNKKVMA
ncbi:hypothetical protein ACHHYP_07082 [Achlya hypogyna]|uniref:Uncharacterized protein n=1 Tax=Achlya hypogyna TaxID=1202772 RepID=A0A1V9ZMQ3_ACHHY|nr:hypothetical protein ACHHYP_07082 [Achlya hypogyna]